MITDLNEAQKRISLLEGQNAQLTKTIRLLTEVKPSPDAELDEAIAQFYQSAMFRFNADNNRKKAKKMAKWLEELKDYRYKYEIQGRPLTPDILREEKWQEIPSELKQIEFNKLEESDDGTINCFAIIFRPTINRICIEYSNAKTSIRIVKPSSITVDDYNTLLHILELSKFRIH